MGRNCAQCTALLTVVNMQAQALRALAGNHSAPLNSSPPAGPNQPPPTLAPAVVVSAVDSRAGRDPYLREHLNNVALDLMAAGFDDHEVAQRILDGDKD